MGKITVDKAKLRAAAGRCHEAATAVEGAAGHGTAQALAQLEDDIPEAVTAGAGIDLSHQIAEVAGDLVTALHTLGEGLEKAARDFDTVDVVYGNAAGGD